MKGKLSAVMKNAEVSPAKETPIVETPCEGENQLIEKLKARCTADNLRSNVNLDQTKMDLLMKSLKSVFEALNDGRALDYFTRLKRLENEFLEISKALVPFANRAYLEGEVPEGATVKKYTPSRKWEYPAELVEESILLKAKMKAAEKSGDAKDVTPPFDPFKSKMFAISLKKETVNK